MAAGEVKVFPEHARGEAEGEEEDDDDDYDDDESEASFHRTESEEAKLQKLLDDMLESDDDAVTDRAPIRLASPRLAPLLATKRVCPRRQCAGGAETRRNS
jgi:TATA-binding protein-associated factor Taf7